MNIAYFAIFSLLKQPFSWFQQPFFASNDRDTCAVLEQLQMPWRLHYWEIITIVHIQYVLLYICFSYLNVLFEHFDVLLSFGVGVAVWH